MAFIELRLGDNDKKSVWGGRTLPNPPASSVTQLQTALRAVGTYPGKIDGDFGRKTEFAIKIFQWCLKNSDKALKKSALITHVPNPAIVPSGKYDLTSHAMLTDWVANAFAVTGDLVRVNADNLSNIELGPGFKPVKTAFVTKSEFLISKDAYPMIKAMNA
jgi:hypothetical protein